MNIQLENVKINEPIQAFGDGPELALNTLQTIGECRMPKNNSSRKRQSLKAGERFGRLVVTSEFKNEKKYWVAKVLCDCDCVKTVHVKSLRSGDTKSCGCLHRDTLRKHGLSDHPLMKTHSNILSRTGNSNATHYDRYGGRGVSVCREWRNFKAFYDWAVSNGWKKGLEIDRIDNDGNYEPSNCRWVDRKVNSGNTSKSKIWVIDGVIYSSLREASEALGVCQTTIYQWCHGQTSRGCWSPPKDNCYAERKYQ